MLPMAVLKFVTISSHVVLKFVTIFITHGLFSDFGMYLTPNEPRAWRGSEGRHLFWFCHVGGTISRYFIKFAPGAVTFSARVGKA